MLPVLGKVRAMALDADTYIHLLDDLDMSREHKVEMMEQVSMILQSFVDRAFGIDPVQTCLGIRAKRPTLAITGALDSIHTITADFNRAAGKDAAERDRP